MLKKIGKVIVVAYVVILLIILISMITDAGVAKQVYSLYSSMNVNTNSNFGKQLQFLVSYTQQTGDLTLMEKAGFSEEQAKAVAAGNLTAEDLANNTEQDNSNNSNITGKVGVPTAFNSSNVQSAIDAHCQSWGMSNTSKGSPLWRTKTIDGQTYIYQSQTEAYMPIGRTGNTVGKVGCMMYAMSALVSNVKGEVFGIEDMLTGLGHNIVWNDGFKDVPTTVKNVGLGDLSWNHPDGTNCTPTSVLPKFGVSCQEKSTKGLNTLDSIISNGHYALIHVTDSSGTFTTAQHWFVVVGKSNGKFNAICLGSTRTGHTFDASQWNLITSCNRMYECY